jgi:hypothetical protein
MKGSRGQKLEEGISSKKGFVLSVENNALTITAPTPPSDSHYSDSDSS